MSTSLNKFKNWEERGKKKEIITIILQQILFKLPSPKGFKISIACKRNMHIAKGFKIVLFKKTIPFITP